MTTFIRQRQIFFIHFFFLNEGIESEKDYVSFKISSYQFFLFLSRIPFTLFWWAKREDRKGETTACLVLICLIVCLPDLTLSSLKVEIILFIVRFPGPTVVPGT